MGKKHSECVQVGYPSIAMCECNRPYYGTNCESSLDDYKNNSKFVKCDDHLVLIWSGVTRLYEIDGYLKQILTDAPKDDSGDFFSYFNFSSQSLCNSSLTIDTFMIQGKL